MVTQSTVTVRPTADYAASDNWAVVGAANGHAATSDDSDASYIHTTGGATGNFHEEFALPVIPDGSVIYSITLRYRGKFAAASTWSLYMADEGSAHADIPTVKNTGSPTTYTAAAVTSIGSLALTEALLNAHKLRLLGRTRDTDRTHELYLDINYTEPPVVSSLTPSGTVAVANPPITFDYADTEADPMDRVQARIFTDADVVAAGSPALPLSQTDYDPVYVNTLLNVTGPPGSYSIQPDVLEPYPPGPLYALPNGDYRLYFRARQNVGNLYSEWEFSDFTVDAPSPASPYVLAGEYDAQLGRVELTFFDYEPDVTLFAQRSIDGGETWTTVRQTTTDADPVIFDYEMPPNDLVLYRGFAATEPAPGETLISDPVMPLINDPSFEHYMTGGVSAQDWDGPAIDDFWNLYRPLFGDKIGALTDPGDTPLSVTALVPAWATYLRLRMFVRAINCGPATVVTTYDTGSPVNAITIAGSEDDSGWVIYDSARLDVAAAAVTMDIEIAPPSIVDADKSMLLGIEAVMIVPGITT